MPANGKMAGCIYGSLEAAQEKLQCFRFFLDALTGWGKQSDNFSVLPVAGWKSAT